MKAPIHFLTIIYLLAFFGLSSGLNGELLHVRQESQKAWVGQQESAIDKIFELVAPAPTQFKVRTIGAGGYLGSPKMVELSAGSGFIAELLFSRCVSRAVHNSFYIIPSVSERTLVFPFHIFW